MNYNNISPIYSRRLGLAKILGGLWRKSHLDFTLFVGILLLGGLGLFVLYSAANQNTSLVWHQFYSFILAMVAMLVFAQIPIDRYRSLAPWVFGITTCMLLVVIGAGVVSRGVQRWLSFGWLRFQPSELAKLAVPMMLAWYLRKKDFPLRIKDLLVSCIVIGVPTLLIAKQPDLGTAILVATSGFFVLLLAGVTWPVVFGVGGLFVLTAPIIWHFMHNYQKMRVLTFLSPESDPLGSGYNIIQSKIAIGSGGMLGKGWLHGTQAHLHFLPVRSTDFIFAVYSEEFGLLGCIILFAIFGIIIGRSLYITAHAQDTFSRLFVGSISLSLFSYFFVNIGMVTGILPVVGVPLPLVSYGGSAYMILMTGFGIIMSANAHRKFIGS